MKSYLRGEDFLGEGRLEEGWESFLEDAKSWFVCQKGVGGGKERGMPAFAKLHCSFVGRFVRIIVEIRDTFESR